MGEHFNENLRAARERKNMTQKDVADNIGVAKSTYSLYEKWKQGTQRANNKKLADLLNVSADDLLGLNQEPTTIAAHFDGDDFTEDELEDIRAYADFVKNRRNKK